MNTMRNTLNAYTADRSGNFAVVMAAVLSVVMLASGFALNVGQVVMTKSNLHNALDAAITSTARDITTGRIKEKDARGTVEAFLRANGGTGFASADRIELDSLVIDTAASTLNARASVAIDMVFPLFGSSPVRNVSVESAAVYSDRKIEVAMMLDVTGSMARTWNTDKIGDLRRAASNAVDTLLSLNGRANPRVRVAIVPYADAVNTGALAHTVHVEERFTEGEPPRLDAPRLVGHVGFDACATERKGRYQFSDASPYDAMVNRDIRLDYCPADPLRPLSSDGDSLKAAIGGLRADGYTAGHIGIQWSWYLLSPKWASVLPAAARPEPYARGKVTKYAILMTDGEFNTAFAGVAEHERTRGGQPTRSRGYAERLCDAMKDEGIEIFTVGFMLEEPGARAVMRDCASPDNSSVRHHFDTHSGSELNDAFQEIALNIERLALTR
ncbi:MAG: pilus assembly protein [Rhizobiaceae bacterium]|nr:pilus assembly protein [Rhizobiaceae bacterium]